MVKAGNVHDGDRAENGETFHLQFGSGKVGMMGTGNFNITLARDQMADHPFEFGISLLPGVEPSSRLPSSVATWWSSRRAAPASTMPSTS